MSTTIQPVSDTDFLCLRRLIVKPQRSQSNNETIASILAGVEAEVAELRTFRQRVEAQDAQLAKTRALLHDAHAALQEIHECTDVFYGEHRIKPYFAAYSGHISIIRRLSSIDALAAALTPAPTEATPNA